MAFEVSCPTCQHLVSIPDQFTDREVTCPKCQMQFTASLAQVLDSEVVPMAQVVPEALPESSPPHPGFWGAVLCCLGILLVTQLLPGLVSVTLLNSGGRKPEAVQAVLNSFEYAQAMLPAMLLSQILSVATAWLAIRLIVGKEWPRMLALRWPSRTHLVLVLIGFPGLIVISMGVDGLAKRVLPSFVDLQQVVDIFGKWPWPLGVLVIGLGPGIGEELWFRGFFGRGLLGRYGLARGILLTSLLFGLIHLEPHHVASALVIGVFLHLSYLVTRSLLVPIILHTANNSLSILAMHSSYLRAIDMPPERVPWCAYGASVLLVTAVGWALFKTQALLIDHSGSDAHPWQPAFPGVECPPLATATRLVHPALGGASWIVVVVAILLFTGTMVAVVKQDRVFVPSAQEVAELLRRQPMSTGTWPAWSRRLREWLGDTSHNADAAYDAARLFLDQEHSHGVFRAPMREDAMAWYICGRGYIRQIADRRGAAKRGSTAEALLRQSIHLDSTIGRAHYALAVALLMQANPDALDDPRHAEARTAAAEGERLDPSVPAKSAEAWAAILQGRFAAAERLYREVLEERPHESERGRAVAMAIVWNKEREGSFAAAVEALLQQFPDNGDLRCLLAVALSRDGRPRSAGRELDRAREQGIDPVKSLPIDWVRKIEAERNDPEEIVGTPGRGG